MRATAGFRVVGFMPPSKFLRPFLPEPSLGFDEVFMTQVSELWFYRV